jgi:hypothetical protein
VADAELATIALLLPGLVTGEDVGDDTGEDVEPPETGVVFEVVPVADVVAAVPVAEAVDETAEDGLGVALSPHFSAAELTSSP